MINKNNLYFQNLLEILKENENLNFNEQNRLWLSKYKILEQHINNSNLEMLPEIITLIYPQFLVNESGENINNDYRHIKFSSSINLADSCQYSEIESTGVCSFNKYRTIRGKCQADHFWPYSLGGPTIAANRVLLCKFHNVSKSNSIMNSFWNNYPTWLNTYLENIYNRKK